MRRLLILVIVVVFVTCLWFYHRHETEEMSQLQVPIDHSSDAAALPAPPLVMTKENMKKKLDWTKLPPHLEYLAAPAEKYGSIQFEDKIMDFWKGATQAEKIELSRLCRQTLKHEKEIDAWIDKLGGLTEHREAALVYFLEHLIALGNDNGYLNCKPNDM